METTNWPDFTRSLSAELRNLRGGAPDVMKAFSSLAQAALAQGALDPKTKELIASASRSRRAATTASHFTSRPPSITAPRAKRCWKRSAWRSTWERARRRCTQATRSAPIRSSPPRAQQRRRRIDRRSAHVQITVFTIAKPGGPRPGRLRQGGARAAKRLSSTCANRTSSPRGTFPAQLICRCRASIQANCRPAIRSC